MYNFFIVLNNQLIKYHYLIYCFIYLENIVPLLLKAPCSRLMTDILAVFDDAIDINGVVLSVTNCS